MGLLLPDLLLFIYYYAREEAVLSSQIEETQSSVADHLLFESDQAVPVPQRTWLKYPTMLLPGEFRTSQNCIGGSRPGNATYVPPPPAEMLVCLDSFERFLHLDTPGVPPLIKAALAHVQFESIHPFPDGNGRLGRQLITLMLCSQNVIHEPILYLSLFFKQNRERYYELLQAVRETGDWESWIGFYLEGIESTAENAYSNARRLVALFDADRKRFETHKRSSGSLLRMHEVLRQRPIWQAPKLAKAMNLTVQGVRKLIATMIDEEVLREISGKERYQVYCYQRYLDILNEGTEPLARAA